MTSNCSFDERIKLRYVNLSSAEFLKILSLFSSGIKAKREKSIDKPKPFDTMAKDLRTKK